jgi:hypothetical protein
MTTQFAFDEGTEWTMLDIGKEATREALGAHRVSGPVLAGGGFVFVTRCPEEGMTRTITVACQENGMLSLVIAPPPEFTRADLEDSMIAVVYQHVAHSLGELPLLVFETTELQFGVHVSGTTREDVAYCVTGILARMVCLSHTQFVQFYAE